MTKKVAVLMGGCSSERGVSLSSGKNVLKALEEAGYDAFSLDLSHDLTAFVETLKKEKPDVVFNALHGQYGEDGCVQGVLDIMQIPYTHSGRLASALAMNKIMAKKLYRMAGLPVAVDRIVSKEDILAGNVLPHPFVLKPVSNGSSVGVYIFRENNGRKPFEGEKYPYADDDEIMAEEYVEGRELTVAVMNGKALGVLEITKPNMRKAARNTSFRRTCPKKTMKKRCTLRKKRTKFWDAAAFRVRTSAMTTRARAKSRVLQYWKRTRNPA